MPELLFHYVITIHNQENLLGSVLDGVAQCAGVGSIIIPVLDGCTDRSESVVRAFAARAGVVVRPVTTPDVHEIQAINSGLRECGPGFCVVLQDDIVLREPALEARLRTLREQHDRQLGLVSLRMGGGLGTESWRRRVAAMLRTPRRWPPRTVDIINLVGSSFDTHGVPRLRTLLSGEFVSVPAVYKSPVCLMPELREAEPLLDETLAPYGYDDLDLSIRSLSRGLRNGVFALAYTSELTWGGTRKSQDFVSNAGSIIMRNRAYLWQKHRDFLTGPGRAYLRYR